VYAEDEPPVEAMADSVGLYVRRHNPLLYLIDPLIKSPTFQRDGLLVITFDEASADDSTHGGGRVAWVAVSARSKPGYQSTRFYQHQSTLRLIAKALGLTALPNAAATAPDMDEFFTTPGK